MSSRVPTPPSLLVGDHDYAAVQFLISRFLMYASQNLRAEPHRTKKQIFGKDGSPRYTLIRRQPRSIWHIHPIFRPRMQEEMSAEAARSLNGGGGRSPPIELPWLEAAAHRPRHVVSASVGITIIMGHSL